MCGIPKVVSWSVVERERERESHCNCSQTVKVRVLGTVEDWQLLHAKVQNLATFFSAHDKMASYLNQAATGVSFVFQRRDAAHWKEFFAISRCHSGHTDVVEVSVLIWWCAALLH
jgi:hypothetical protein